MTCSYCTNITVCVICGKGYAEAIRARAEALANDARDNERFREALREIALAGMSGTGMESEEAMRAFHARQAWNFIQIAARALMPDAAAGATPKEKANAA